VQLYKLRLKRLLFEHQADAVESQTDGRVAMKAAQETHAAAEHELGADARDLKAVLRDMEVAQDEFVRALKVDSDRAATEARLEFERDTRELQASFEDRLQRLREQLTRAREEDVRGIEGRKSRHIQSVIASHEKAFADIKLYYNEITHSNLDLIKSLKEEVEDLKKKESADEKGEAPPERAHPRLDPSCARKCAPPAPARTRALALWDAASPRTAPFPRPRPAQSCSPLRRRTRR
jgi:hypothetical protein